MIDVSKLEPRVLQAVRQNAGLEPDDSSLDHKFAMLDEERLFDRYLVWQGLIGWSDTLISVIDNIRAAKTD